MKIRGVLLVCLFLFSFTAAAQEEGIIESLKFKDADISIVLQAITQKAVRDGQGVNILVAPDVKGLVSVNLTNVSWQTALDAVLKTYDYGYEWSGKNIILVDTLENLAAKRKRIQEAQIAEPLDTRAFTLSFAKVEDVKATAEKMLTERGRLTYDTRTNTIVITDTQSNLAVIERTVESLDEITPQVHIEAKVIETDLDVSQRLGVDWNISGTVSGSRRAHNWPFKSSTSSNYVVDSFPSVATAYPGADLTNAFTWGTMNASALSATLDIIFSDTDTQILSMPKITTLDNNTATIDVVTEDPVPQYAYNADTGFWEISGYQFIRYGVSMAVTPQINKEGFITLTVKPVISENTGNKEFTSSGGNIAEIPVLNTQTTSTKVMIRDGETLVIAGLIRDKTIDIVNKVPVLGDIPILGYLFRHKNKSVVKKNLLIFITPTIVTPERPIAHK